MSYSTIEGMIRQSTNNPMEQYIILQNGKRLPSFAPTSSLDLVVQAIRELEVGLNRLTQHSPYTIGKVQAIAKLKND